MPSYVDPANRPYRLYQSLQDTSNRVLNSAAMMQQQQQQVVATPENKSNQWK